LLPPKELTRLIRNHYDDSYRNVAAHLPETCFKWTLENWEEDMLARHKMTSGTILVLGGGVGRESIALAQRGFFSFLFQRSSVADREGTARLVRIIHEGSLRARQKARSS